MNPKVKIGIIAAVTLIVGGAIGYVTLSMIAPKKEPVVTSVQAPVKVATPADTAVKIGETIKAQDVANDTLLSSDDASEDSIFTEENTHYTNIGDITDEKDYQQ